MIDQVILVVNLKYHMMSPSEFEHGDKQKIWSHNQTKLESEQAKNSAFIHLPPIKSNFEPKRIKSQEQVGGGEKLTPNRY